jgi:hypothetical protein
LAKEYGLSGDEVTTRLEDAAQTLLKARAARVRPATDDKIIASWNGLTLTLLAEASRFLDRELYLPAAQELAHFLVTEIFIEGRLHRSWRDGLGDHPGMLEDYAAIANGLIDLYQVDFDPVWIDNAQRLVATIMDQFDDTQGGFYDSPADQTDLITRPKSLQDSPLPSGNSLAVRAMLRLDSLTPHPTWQEKALQAVASLTPTAEKYPSMFSAWMLNLDWALGPILQLAISGDRFSQGFRTLVAVSDEVYDPRLIRAGGSQDQSKFVSLMESRPMIENQPTAYLCQDFSCQLPTSNPGRLRQQLAEFIQ